MTHDGDTLFFCEHCNVYFVRDANWRYKKRHGRIAGNGCDKSARVVRVRAFQAAVKLGGEDAVKDMLPRGTTWR